ncbi:hypothetical protein VCHA50O413_10434 [Vibrio chagasii]|nr:hypothetical protein VCHA27O13_80100 [Vibrio chagasii]CAH6799754.1 hypothetical protein VCHA29O37_100059 [Vibrio chagasii]CAH6809135.1 hypothetical protein VCHA35O137_130009 [Vibrio chagasii]CAH6810407.1 hypothetical protein VCHA32P90_130113 [Vibrio chagasii]CAH6814248.1 hypothetical protein VCHA34P117_130059 [Vibrio chagasii]
MIIYHQMAAKVLYFFDSSNKKAPRFLQIKISIDKLFIDSELELSKHKQKLFFLQHSDKADCCVYRPLL